MSKDDVKILDDKKFLESGFGQSLSVESGPIKMWTIGEIVGKSLGPPRVTETDASPEEKI